METTTISQQATRDSAAAAMNEFINELSHFKEADFNRVPFAGSWTPGQVAEHVLKSSYGIAKGIGGGSVEADRDPAKLIPQFEAIFLDFSSKMKSPDFILPSNDQHSQKEMIGKLEQTFNQIRKAGDELNLTQICTDFEFPTIGKVSRLELLHFCYVHTKRHAHQLAEMRKFLS